MGESIAEELVQLLRGFSASLTLRLSHLIAFFIRYKVVSSLNPYVLKVSTLLGHQIINSCTFRSWRDYLFF